MMHRIPLLLALLISPAISLVAFGQENIPHAERMFFEEKVRPILVGKCYQCHAEDAKEIGGKLLLDSRAGILKGGESGPAVVPGDPEKSLLLDALHYESFEMPPDKPLSEAEIHLVSQWIERGAWDPRMKEAQSGPKESWTPQELWSFYPRQVIDPPSVGRQDWPQGSIDRFVLHKIEAAGAQPTEDAELSALVRRLYYDLIGLPPTLEEIQTFVQAATKDRRRATEALVDELLARPQFGEHWGRHWLDVARYGESNGNDGLSRNATFPHAWRYRDYVIDAINRDIPYDRFLTEQIAGDLLPAATPQERNRLLVATGFLAIGSKPASAMNKDFPMDIVDDQINTVSTAIMGLSVACARCHDHKHDPIPTRDYYALAGIFKSSETLYGAAGNEKLTAPPTELHVLASELPDGGGKRDEMKSPLALPGKYFEQLQHRKPVVSVSLDELPDRWKEVGSSKFSDAEFAQLKESYLQGSAADLTSDYTISFWFKNELENNARPITAYLFTRGELGNKEIPGDHLGIGGKHDPKRTGRLFVFNGNRKKESLAGTTVIVPGTWNHVVMVRKGDRLSVYLNGLEKPEIDGKLEPTFGNESRFSLGGRSEGFAPLTGNLAHFSLFSKSLSGADVVALHDASERPKGVMQLGLAMGVREAKKPADCKVHINGTSAKLGAEIPRGALTACWEVVQGDESSPIVPDLKIPKSDSGRLELAAWITDPRQPQTWRVMVNRIWLKLMGEGLVATPDDFGVFGARPTHPELLDWLAQDFIERGGSVKSLIRSIVLSRTYQLSSDYGPQFAEQDPENILLTRHRKRRLSAEQLRDSILSASGALDLEPSVGSPIQEIDALINQPPHEASTLHQPSSHRSIYLCYMRNAPPAELAAFDLPDGLKVTGKRSQTILPAQSLFLLNSSFVIQQAENLAALITVDPATTTEDKIKQAFHRALQRDPTASELDQATRLLERLQREYSDSSKSKPMAPWAVFCQALFASNEFRYVD
ncbi:DUF1553 domain-containing protein [Bremerella sp.]|uniref:DUF1553 domain-containing protein n=1 Tax=Bremerella sp. TaxID=2795602 RepID=UPI00391A3806